MKAVTFFDGTILYLEEITLVKMYRYVQSKKSQNESGGILLGRQIENREEYILSDISEPTKKDKKGRFSFTRDKQSAQFVIDQKWKETNGVENYLGEWHTHPECNPTPSQIDRNLVRQVINDNSNVFTKVFLIIVGVDQSLYIGLANSNVSNDIIFSTQLRGIR